MDPRDGRTIFVFGSNIGGRHGRGAALHARREHGAIYGQGEGPQGQSYAIPTKDASLRSLSLDAIAQHVTAFKAYAAEHPELTFAVTPVGTGLAGHKSASIAPMFADAPGNVQLPREFLSALDRSLEGAARFPSFEQSR